MEIRLSKYDRSFATRERAQEILASLGTVSGPVLVDIHGVMTSPSFLAELFVGLANKTQSITVAGADEYRARTITNLARQLGLTGSVKLAELA